MSKLYFSDYFEVTKKQLYDYGTVDISLFNDLPLFIDPFLLFNSDKKEYRFLHDHIIDYLAFIRDKSIMKPSVTDGELKSWFCFKEVKENWFGYTEFGNTGKGLGMDFARSMHRNLHTVFTTFSEEEITKGSHLEKLCLIKDNVGKDNISDLTTNLIKDYLLQFTESFAKQNIGKDKLRKFSVPRAYFSKQTETWQPKSYTLPVYGDEFVILTPRDILTKDDIWINRDDLVGYFDEIPNAISDEELRAQINNYFNSQLPPPTKKKQGPTKKERAKAATATISKFPVLIDYYIKLKEERGESAIAVSVERVEAIESKVDQAQELTQSLNKLGDFNTLPATSIDEAITRANYLKDCIEKHEGYQVINSKFAPKPNDEKQVQLLLRMVWFGSHIDLNKEVNNGRGPVDYTASFGALDKSIIEFKLGSNSRLKHGLEKQTEIYLKANSTDKKVIIIVCYTEKDQNRVNNILQDLKLNVAKNIIVIDARNDNKPSASKA